MTDIPLAARKFDELPDSALVDVRTVAIVFGISVVTAWRRSAMGRLPKPERAPGTNTTRWQVGELRRVLSAQRPVTVS